MSNKFFSTSIRPIFVWAFLIVVIAVCLWFISLKYIEWQDLASQPSSLDKLKAENDNLTTIAQICGGLFLLVGLCFTGWNAWIAQTNMVIAQRNMRLAEDGKITDRFSKAVEQLGSDKLEIRLGGIYALERIAIDSEKDHPQVMEVFTAFVRNNSFRKKNEIYEPTSLLILPVGSRHSLDQKVKLDTDIQAILTVIGRRKSAHVEREKCPLDLNRTYLSEAFLMEANLKEAELEGADLTGANLVKAHLEGADLWGANLTGAELQEANLTGALLFKAHLTGSFLTEANLTGALLFKAHLEGADLWGADLTGASLQEANLTGAINLTIDQLSTVETLYNVVLDSTLLKQVQENHPRLLEKP